MEAKLNEMVKSATQQIIKSVQEHIAPLLKSVEGISGRQKSAADSITDLERRVAALEGKGTS